MRIAVQPNGEPGARAARILLAERTLSELGMYGRSLANADDRRARPIDDLAGFDVLVSDATDHPDLYATEALAAGVSCVLWSDLWEDRDAGRRLGEQFAAEGLTLLIGASLGTGLAAALASHELARTDVALELQVAWTVPGRPLRKGEAIPFPKPVGSLWARPVEDPDLPARIATRWYVAPTPTPWAGAMARMTGVLDNGVAQRVVGVADHGAHLEGLALAAGAIAVAAGAYPPGLQWPGTEDEYLDRALEAGLAVATYTVEESTRRRP